MRSRVSRPFAVFGAWITAQTLGVLDSSVQLIRYALGLSELD
jgi:hypothetical protein